MTKKPCDITKRDYSQSSVEECKLFGGANYPQDNDQRLRVVTGMKNIALPKTLKKLMESKKISLRKLAKETGINQSTISGYLSSTKKTYDPVHLGTLSEFFSVSIDYLLFGKEKTSFGSLKTKKLFSRVVKLTIEDFDDDEEAK